MLSWTVRIALLPCAIMVILFQRKFFPVTMFTGETSPPLFTLILVPTAVTAGIAYVLWSKRQRNLAVKFCNVRKDLSGQVAVITGANCGLGLETAVHIASMGSMVVLACRNVESAEQAKSIIFERAKQLSSEHEDESETKKTPVLENLIVMHLDLSRLSSVETFVNEFKEQFKRLDLLVNNAGIMNAPFDLSADGIELHFATNHLGHFRLTNLLADILAATEHSRVITVTSGYYLKTSGDAFEDNFTDETLKSTEAPSDYDGTLMYARSKLANCLHAYELAKRFKNRGISVYAVRPGFVRGTNLGRYWSLMARALSTPLVWFVSRSPNQGVQTILHCCLTDSDQLTSGALYNNCEHNIYAPVLVNDSHSRAMWELSSHLVHEALNS